MAINAHKLGPGLLTIGAVGTPKELAVECTKVALVPESQDGDTLVVLSGDRDQDAAEDTFKLDITLVQNFEQSGVIAWTWENAGDALPFTFVPNVANAMQVKGEVRVARATIGGDVDSKNTSDLSLVVLGVPVMSHDYAPAP